MFTDLLGHELRLEVMTELLASEVCRSDEEITESHSASTAVLLDILINPLRLDMPRTVSP